MSRINFGPQSFIYPMPVLIVGTYDENGVPNAMNAACDYVGVESATKVPDKFERAGFLLLMTR